MGYVFCFFFVVFCGGFSASFSDFSGVAEASKMEEGLFRLFVLHVSLEKV